MNYSESLDIFRRIKDSKRVLLNCHHHPDADSIGSALSLYQVIKNLNIEVDIVCPASKLPSSLQFLEGYDDVMLNFDFDNYNRDSYDLIIILDSATTRVVTGNPNSKFSPDIRNLIVIDHHEGNKLTSNLKIIDIESSSVGELLFKFFEDNGIEISPSLATSLLTGVFGDTAVLTLPNATKSTYEVVNKLVQLGADKQSIIMHLNKSETLKMYKFWRMALEKIKIDSICKFAYVFISENEYKEFVDLESAKPKFASLFSNGLINTDFGVVGIETKKGTLNISFRARTDFDTTLVSRALGGGGHKAMSAVIIDGLPFDQAVEKVLEVCRKYANKN